MKKLVKILLTGIALAVLFSFTACQKKTSSSNLAIQTGLKFDAKRYDKVPQKAQLLKRSYENLPSKVLLTDYTPPVADQGNFGTCVAWASTYAGMTTAEAYTTRNTRKYDLEIKAFSPYYLYRKCNPSEIKNANGMYPEDALDWLVKKGVPRRSTNEMYSTYATFDMSAYDKADLYTIESYSRLGSALDFTNSNVDDVAYSIIRNIKKSISEKKPVLGCFWVTNDFMNQYGSSDFIPYDIESDYANFLAGKGYGGHAMLIVGYDDKRYYEDGQYYGAFLIQNSWGTDWGEDGYIWVDYEVACVYLMGAYEISNNISKVYDEDDEVVPVYDYYYYDYDDYDWWWYYDYEPEYEPEPEPEPKKDPKQIPVIVDPDSELEDEPQPEPEKLYCIFEGEFSLPLYNEDGQIKVSYKNNCYETSQGYDSFTRFQLYMTNKRPCYVYAFAADQTMSKPERIFPPENVNALLDYHENTVVYPSEDSCIRMDAQEGTDYLIVLYSLSALELEDVMKAYQKEIKKNPSDVYGAVVKACGADKIVPAANQTFAPDSINFNAMVSTVSKAIIMPIVIKIKHL